MKKINKKILISFNLIFALTFFSTFVFAQNQYTAENTNPNVMGWMQGFPPSPDKILSSRDRSFFAFPALRYSVNHMNEFCVTREVESSNEKKSSFKVNIDKNIDDIKFVPWGAKEEMTFLESLSANYTDGIIILHNGKIIYEKYPAGLTQDGKHAAMSVSKSFAGTVAAILVANDILDPEKLVTDYIPELKNSGYEGATVRQVMDMTTAIKYSEDYSDPNAEIWAYSMAGDNFRLANYSGPKNYYEYLTTLKKIKGVNHGDAFGYKTVNTELLGWINSRVTNKGMAELVSELIWKPIGANYNAYYQLDPAGIASAGGGLSLNLRDLALFGQVMLNEGKINGKQVIPQAAIKDISKGGSTKESQEKFTAGGYKDLKGWSYRDMWWITNNKNGAYMARGVHGQALYIDPTAKMVIARFASAPYASNTKLDPTSIPAYQAVADYLTK